MATYTDAEKKRILSYPIEKLLAHFGKRTQHRANMYFSPFRDEKTPSLHVDTAKNLWMDFGSGEGGNVLTMASILAGIPVSRAWEYVAKLDPDIVISEEMNSASARRGYPSRIVIDKVYDRFTLRKLLRYGGSRGIPQHLLQRYCRQVSYHISCLPHSIWTVIGFQTNDGWVLRHSYDGAYTKRSTISSCTYLGMSGEQTTTPTSERVEVFEGFFDFLSWLVLKGKTKPFCDICVLNSVSNTSRAMDFITSHSQISCWLDNDRPGEEAFELIRGVRSDSVTHLQVLRDASCNDLNEYLKSTLPSQKEDNTHLCSNIHNKIKP